MIEGSTLVLNRSWLAIHITPARRALTLLYAGHARAVHPVELTLYDFAEWCIYSQNGLPGKYIYTPAFRVRLPEVVVLNFFNGFIRHELRFSRSSIYERDNSTCQYCNTKLHKSHLTLDHVIPVSRGGEESWENLVVACLKCNVRKGNRTPEEAGMPLIRGPRKPSWIPALAARVPREQRSVWMKFLDPSEWTYQMAE